MSIKKGIGYSPLTEKIYLGKQNKEKSMWVGDKEDITNEFLNVLFEYVPKGSSRIIKSGSGTNIILNIEQNEVSMERAIEFLKNSIEDYNLS